MALIVEDGTGKSDAESYISVADADNYHGKRGNSTGDEMTTEEKEQALRRATDYMEQSYRLNWLGYRRLELQALSWPRDEVQRQDFTYLNQFSFYPNDQVPREVKEACAELAWRAAAGELSPDLSQGVIREKVDVLEVEYDKYSPQSPRYKVVDMLLAPFLTGYVGAMRKVVRT